ncbi:MAG TPA: N-6 DNA methylase [archaeon]|nr:N-6 DNA methylase [archaeon]
MKQFQAYIDHLENLLEQLKETKHPEDFDHAIAHALDGQPSKELRRLVPLDNIRSTGAFFTSSTLAEHALLPVLQNISKDAIFLDPASGAGDLLIACAKHLPKDSNLTDTLHKWGKRLFGCETQKEFVKACKLRLMLAAIQRVAKNNITSLSELDRFLPGIKCQSGLDNSEIFKVVNHIVINPPFKLVESPQECQWANGSVNYAAVFMHHCIFNAEPGTHVVAILPEVLRSGARYSKWRKFVESKCFINRVELFGQFDKWADVDVFILDAKIRNRRSNRINSDWGYPQSKAKKTIKDFFKVSVGSVVPHRDEKKGNWFPYISARDIPAWDTVTEINKRLRFLGTTFTPPFVVVRRTSRPSDKYRAVGTIIENQRSIAVENHLIVLEPRDGTVSSCKKLIKILKKTETNEWLNKRICCRHLTVSAISDIPWEGLASEGFILK